MIQSVVYRDSKFVADCPPPESLAALRQDPAVIEAYLGADDEKW